MAEASAPFSTNSVARLGRRRPEGGDARGVVGRRRDRRARPTCPTWPPVLDGASTRGSSISIGTDFRPTGEGFRVDHIFSQDRRKTWIVLRAYASAEDPRVPSITPRRARGGVGRA